MLSSPLLPLKKHEFISSPESAMAMIWKEISGQTAESERERDAKLCFAGSVNALHEQGTENDLVLQS